MIGQCFSLALLFGALNFANITIPVLQYDGTTLMNDLNVPTVNLKNPYLVMNATDMGMMIGEGSVIHGSFKKEFFFKLRTITLDWLLKDSDVMMFNHTPDVCTTDSLSFHCDLVGSTIHSVANAGHGVQGPSGINASDSLRLAFGPAVLGGIINGELYSMSLNTTMPEPNSFPAEVEGSKRLNETAIFPALLDVVDSLPHLLGVSVTAALPTDNGFSLNITTATGIVMRTPELSFSSPLGFVEAVLQLPVVRSLLKLVTGRLGLGGLKGTQELLRGNRRSLGSMSEMLQAVALSIPPFSVENMSLFVDLPPRSSVQVDIAFNDLQCDASGYVCTVQPENGIEVVNLRTSTNGYIDPLLANMIGPKLLNITNGALNNFTNKSYPDRMTIPMWSKPDEENLAPALPMTLAGCGLIIIVGLLVVWSIWRHRVSPSYYVSTGAPVPLWRVLVEDIFVSATAAALFVMFLWCTMTSVGVVELGGMEMYSFSLLHTTQDMWKAKMYALAIFVFVFSGMYPFFKLASMVACTVVLRRPNSIMLRAIDYLGKFSFLDIFSMMVLAAALEIKGIAVAVFQPSYYIFVAATVCSLLLGNYCTQLWRRGTTTKSPIRKPVKVDAQELEIRDSPLPYGEKVVFPSGMEKKRTLTDRLRGTYVWGIMWMVGVPAFCVIVGCTIPSFVSPSVRFHITKLVSLVEGSQKEFTVYELAQASNTVCVIVVFITMIIAPAFYALFYPLSGCLASWCSSDVFLLACVAGLWQLPNFVEFILGDVVASVFMVHAELLILLLPLGIAALVPWGLIAVELLVLSRVKGSGDSVSMEKVLSDSDSSVTS